MKADRKIPIPPVFKPKVGILPVSNIDLKNGVNSKNTKTPNKTKKL